MGCASSKQFKRTPGYEDPNTLANETTFSVNEVEPSMSYKLFHIQRWADSQEEFQLALFQEHQQEESFADRIFDLFDLKRNGVIEFESLFGPQHFPPDTPTTEKVAFAFRLYDLRGTGFIEREEWKWCLPFLMNQFILSDEAIEQIVDQYKCIMMNRENMDSRRGDNTRLRQGKRGPKKQ
ncbi:hypothetical protein EJB05_24175 [Eragrostis curvula]|uniref:Calcineurin B-like protein n=1 Tax=Eragrostis curvula TaxID=38414 RepID=A0A5J9VAB8_9POAL|nr:hypothetical protein EJB05_24175 [Eragrostis curvula]